MSEIVPINKSIPFFPGIPADLAPLVVRIALLEAMAAAWKEFGNQLRHQATQEAQARKKSRMSQQKRVAVEKEGELRRQQEIKNLSILNNLKKSL